MEGISRWVRAMFDQHSCLGNLGKLPSPACRNFGWSVHFLIGMVTEHLRCHRMFFAMLCNLFRLYPLFYPNLMEGFLLPDRKERISRFLFLESGLPFKQAGSSLTLLFPILMSNFL